MHVCILRRELNIYRLLPHAGTSATQQTYKHEFMTHTFLYLIVLRCIEDEDDEAICDELVRHHARHEPRNPKEYFDSEDKG